MLWPSSVAFRFIAVLFLSVSNLSSNSPIGARGSQPLSTVLVASPREVSSDLSRFPPFGAGLGSRINLDYTPPSYRFLATLAQPREDRRWLRGYRKDNVETDTNSNHWNRVYKTQNDEKLGT